MKIVRIIARLNVGGPARHVTWLTRELQDDEFQSVLVAGTVPEGEQDMGYFAAEQGVRPVFIKEMSRELSMRDAVSFLKILRLLFREKPDVVHTHTAKAGTVGRLAALAYRLVSGKNSKIVHTYHGHVFHSYYGRALTLAFLTIERVLAKIATDRIVVISEQQRREICETFYVGRPNQYRVIGLGIDLQTLESASGADAPLRAELGFTEDDFVVGFVGRLTEIKNIPMLIEAASILFRSGRSQALKFVIVGEGGLRDSLEALVRAEGLGDTVKFAGHRDDTAAVYQAFDAVALTSLNEGTPLSLIEAMAAGKPVVSSAVGGVVDLVGPVSEKRSDVSICERGLTVASGDAGGLADALHIVATDQGLRNSLSESGRRFVRSNYGKDRLVADVKNLYRELVARES